VQKRIVGDERVDALYANASDDVQTLTFSMPVALGGADAQVRAHVAVNLNVGNDRAALLGVLTVLVPFIGCPALSTDSMRASRLPTGASDTNGVGRQDTRKRQLLRYSTSATPRRRTTSVTKRRGIAAANTRY
jgi:hypothetical protein